MPESVTRTREYSLHSDSLYRWLPSKGLPLKFFPDSDEPNKKVFFIQQGNLKLVRCTASSPYLKLIRYDKGTSVFHHFSFLQVSAVGCYSKPFIQCPFPTDAQHCGRTMTWSRLDSFRHPDLACVRTHLGSTLVRTKD